ncbi:hypothetical protein LR010_02005 [Candidatus Gracilibacteria bacterium]|nr:hypothetical protein [Candidatus Gracilibacteria bacterium]
MKKLLFLLFVFISLDSSEIIFASSGELSKPQTLVEMQAEKDELEKQETLLKFKWDTFKLGNDSLEDIVKTDLTDIEKTNLEELILLYLEGKEYLESDLNNAINSGKDILEIKKSLLNGKHDFYKQLIPYIQTSKLEAFKSYVDSDLNYNEKSKDIQTKINQKGIEQEKRLEELYDDRDDSARSLRKNIENSITLKVTPKINKFISQESFIKLSSEIKIEIFTNIKSKFEIAIDKLGDQATPTRALEERIIGLEVVVDILDSYIDNWR